MFKREFKINLKSLIIWTVILLATYILVFSIYPSLINEETKASIKQMMTTMPKEMLSTFNMDIVGIESAYGWFRTEGFIFLTLVGGLYSSILGATILLKEENDKTIDFLYSKPISRNKIVTSKILCGILNIFIFTAIITLVNGIALKGTTDFRIKQFLMIDISPLLVFYLFFFITLFISNFLRKTKKSMGVSIGLVFINYFMQIIGGMGDKVKIIKDISLFEFASSRYIIINDKINTKYLLIGMALIIISIIGTYVKYNHKEFV